jgi:hypothetical protein
VAAGGFSFKALGCVPSSYLAELAGAVDVLRSLMECVEEGEVPGEVQHWCDNEGVVQRIRKIESLKERQWRSSPARHLWAEMRWRLAWWRENGGGWVTKWVKGHVDKIAARTQETYTAAEWANIEADRLAEWAHSQEAVAVVEARPAGTQLGGTWWVEQGRGYREKWWDGIPTAMWGSGREKEIRQYWEARQRRRGEGGRTAGDGMGCKGTEKAGGGEKGKESE